VVGKYDVSSLKSIGSGAAPLDRTVRDNTLTNSDIGSLSIKISRSRLKIAIFKL
jgi:hypothetical protein